MTKKIAVVNRTNLKNYGSVLQVYALYRIVKDLDYDAEVVWLTGNLSSNFDIRPNKIISIGLKLFFNPRLIWSTYKTAKTVVNTVVPPVVSRMFEVFVETYIPQKFYGSKEIQDIAYSDYYSKFICGSDQIWVTTTLYPDPMMYLRFAPVEKRIAYAPSLGRNYIPSYNKHTLGKFINDFPCLSVREDEGRRLIQELTGRNAVVVADPTLLETSSDWMTLKNDVYTPPVYLLCYFLSEPNESTKIDIFNFASRKNLDIVVLGKLGEIDYPSDKVYYPAAGPSEFLSLIDQAKYIITDSYHGMLFALNFNKIFWSIERNYEDFDQSSRQKSILKQLNLMDRYIIRHTDFSNDFIDYTSVNESLQRFRDLSIDYLRQSLSKE